MKEKINPTGLKGNQITERMKELMGIQPINENKTTSVVELTKRGPDGKVYGIVRENHEYYIKITEKQKDLAPQDFKYIGGLQNKKQEAYPSYAKAIKHLNLKFHSLNEALGKQGNINVFQDDKLMGEGWAGFAEMSGPMFKAEGNLEGHMKSDCCGAQTMEGMCMECGGSAYGTMGEMEMTDETEMMDEKKYSDAASDFISKEISHLMKDKGYTQDRAVAAALSVAREKGYKVPEKSDESMDMMAQGGKAWENLEIKITEVKEGDYIIVRGNSYYVTGMPYYKEGVYYVPTASGTFESEKNKVEVHRLKMADGGMMNEKEFPDLTGDGKVTYADILKGRGVELNNEELSPEMEAVDAMMEDDNSFTSHGSYTVSNAGGYEIMLSPDGEAAKVRDAYGSDNPKTSDWLPIKYVQGDDGDMEPIIDPEGYSIPLNQVMRVDEMTGKEKEFASLAPPKNKITYADKIAGATKKEGRLSIERAMSMMDEMIDELSESKSKKKL